jgi:putative transcriptional regulator
MAFLEGQLLLASRRLLDPNFAHTVVLLIQHNPTGALGVVLNRPTSKTVQELWRQVGDTPCESRQPVHLGGPVSGPVMAVHTLDDLAEAQIVPGLYFAAKKPNLDELVRRDGDHRYKLFVGHAGWGPGQLENELAEGAWQTTPARLDDIFDDADDLWQRLLHAAEAGTLPAMLGIKHIPPDPSVN